MARAYILKRRAESQTATRRRIVEAAVDLHTRVGPALTSFSMVAEHAGVQRHTLYAHFPDERHLLLACSALALERDPLPESGVWREMVDRDARLRAGLAAVYGWYQRNSALAGCVLRDAEHHVPTREVIALRLGLPTAGYHDVLGAGLSQGQRAMLQVALSFFTWRTLTRDCGQEQRVAVDVMVQAILGGG